MSLIKTSECVKCTYSTIDDTNKAIKCTYSTIDDTNKAKVIIHCKAKGKEFIYGQYVECDAKKRNKK